MTCVRLVLKASGNKGTMHMYAIGEKCRAQRCALKGEGLPVPRPLPRQNDSRQSPAERSQ